MGDLTSEAERRDKWGELTRLRLTCGEYKLESIISLESVIRQSIWTYFNEDKKGKKPLCHTFPRFIQQNFVLWNT